MKFSFTSTFQVTVGGRALWGHCQKNNLKKNGSTMFVTKYTAKNQKSRDHLLLKGP